MFKQTVLHLSHIIPLSNKKTWTVVHIAAWMALKGIGSERSRSQKVTYCTIPFMTISKQNKTQQHQNDHDEEKIRGCQRLGEGVNTKG